MSNMLNINENMQVILEKLENFFTSKTVVGEPIKIGETTIIPLINITFGIGGGGGDGDDGKGQKGVGGGTGTGARIAPAAVLVIQNGKVELLPIKKTGGLDKLLEMVPDVVDKVKDMKCCGKTDDLNDSK
jgi:uncharacterized spore protein YtfJ